MTERRLFQVRPLLFSSSAKMTLDVYAQAPTPNKRAAQRKVVAMIQENLSVRRVYHELTALQRKLLIRLGVPDGI